MVMKHADPGGSTTGGTQQLSNIAGSVTAQTSVTNGQAYAYLFNTGSPAAGASAKAGVGALQAGGNRLSVFSRVPVLSADNTSVTGLAVTPTGSLTALLNVTIGSDGKLRLYTNGITTALGAAGASVLAVDTWRRITLSYAITSTTNWSAKVYLDGVLEFTRTNADGTLSSAAPADIQLGLRAGAGTNYLLYISDLYADDTTDQSDPGNVHVTAKLSTTVASGSWDTTRGTGAVNERPANTSNGLTQAATTQAAVVYNVEGAAAGDVDLTGATILGRAAWMLATLSSLTGTPTGKLQLDGVQAGTSWDPAAANTYQFFAMVDSGSSAPSTVGVSSSGIAADSLLAEIGAIVAYIPSSGPPPVSVDGAQPTATGTLARLLAALRPLAGSQPSATGALTRLLQALRAPAGDQPAASGSLARIYQALRSAAGDQPSATGTLDAVKAVLRDLAGDEPASSGALARLLAALRSLAGSQPTATGDLARQIAVSRSVAGDQPAATGTLDGVKATFRDLAGDQPAASGALTRLLQAFRSLNGDQPAATGTLARLANVTRSLAGNQPAASGALSRIKQALRSLSGSQPAGSGTLSAAAVTPRRALVTWLEFEAPFAIRTLTGNQPSASGTLSRIKQALRSLAGSQPAATGTLARIKQALRSLDGNQPAASGVLTRLLHALRSLTGDQPAATGTLARQLSTTRALAGSQPAATGTIARLRIVFRTLAGDQPAPSGDLARLLSTTRLLAGDEPTATGELARQISVTRVLDGEQPSATGTLTGFRNLIGTGHGRLVLRERSGSVLLSDRRSGSAALLDRPSGEVEVSDQ